MEKTPLISVGAGVVEITPPVGMPLSGFIARGNRPSTGIDSPLYVCALAFQQDEEVYLLLSYDLLGLGAPQETLILEHLHGRLGPGFNTQHCVLLATHNHSGPSMGLLVGEANPDVNYLDRLAAFSAQAAALAVEQLQPVRLFLAEARLPALTYNRRALLADGRVSISPQPDAPVVERGPLDDRLTVLLWRSPQGENLAVALHFACHGVAVMTQHIGADIPGEFSTRLSQRLGAPCLFLQGAAGDVNPTTATAERTDLLAWMERAMTCLDGLEERFRPATGTPLQALNGQVNLPFAPLPSLEDTIHNVQALERIAAGDVTSPDLQQTIRAFKNTMNMRPDEALDPGIARFVALALAQAGRITLQVIQRGQPLDPLPLRLGAWQMGEVVLVYLAAEVFTSTGLQLRSLMPGLTVLPVTFLSPVVGYIPDPPAMLRGGYEVDDAWRFYGQPAPFQPDAGPRLISAVQDLLAKLPDKKPSI